MLLPIQQPLYPVLVTANTPWGCCTSIGNKGNAMLPFEMVELPRSFRAARQVQPAGFEAVVLLAASNTCSQRQRPVR